MRGGTRRDPRAERGRAAEDAACVDLRRRGYRIVARNLRLAGAEIDIVAREGGTTVFVEVRSRSSRERGGPPETIGRGKQARIARAAAAYLAGRGQGDVVARFDVVGVDWSKGRACCTLVRAAFESPF